ncbi:MAG: MBL fold metallo-hydrolase [Clostridia bacterium]|nr:MBL fold metallo-hydrolase [Clostridia bacterium]
MMELIKAKGNTYYFESPAKVGLVLLGDGTCVLIDSGNDKTAAKRIKRTLDEMGQTLVAIYNTHCHADHIGGNAYLQAQTGCKVYSPGVECDFTNHPILESSLLYSAVPPRPLRGKFMLAEPSVAEPLTADVLPTGFSLLPLGGHALDMVGIRTPDDVLFVGDVVSAPETLAKYRVAYTFDVGNYLASLDTLRGVKAALFVPSHTPPTADLTELLDLNEAAANAVAADILDLCRTPRTHEMLLKALFDKYGLTLTFSQFALVGGALRAYLSWLLDTGRVEPLITENYLYYKAV